jgi:alanine dehydrogenase
MYQKERVFPTSDKKHRKYIWEFIRNMVLKRNVIIFSGGQIENVLPMPIAIKAVELYFKLYAQNVITPYRKDIFEIQGIGDIRIMPADDGDFFNVKLLGGLDRDPAEGVTLSGVNILFTHDSVGCVCISDAKLLTGIRTGAAGAIAVKYLAKKNSRQVTIIGAGNQGYWQLRGIVCVCKNIRNVSVFDINAVKARNASHMWGNGLKDVVIEPCNNLKEAVQMSDIIVTATPSRKPVIEDKWIQPGTHINAIGADTKGKQEVESSLLLRSRVVVDDIEQALRLGELNVPFSHHLISENTIYSTLSDIIIGQKPGRINEEEITLFDSTGLSFQDLAVHRLLFEKAVYLRAIRKIDVGNLMSLNTTDTFHLDVVHTNFERRLGER